MHGSIWESGQSLDFAASLHSMSLTTSVWLFAWFSKLPFYSARFDCCFQTPTRGPEKIRMQVRIPYMPLYLHVFVAGSVRNASVLCVPDQVNGTFFPSRSPSAMVKIRINKAGSCQARHPGTCRLPVNLLRVLACGPVGFGLDRYMQKVLGVIPYCLVLLCWSCKSSAAGRSPCSKWAGKKD